MPDRAWRASRAARSKRLRVVGLDFRPALIGRQRQFRRGGRQPSSPRRWPSATAAGTRRSSWARRPSTRTARPSSRCRRGRPVYFQAVDEQGYVMQTMRSWSTVQPGENASCVGCHESKNSTPGPHAMKEALRRGPGRWSRSTGRRGFSFPREIQPILDRHCIRCHHDRRGLAWLPEAAAETNLPKAGDRDTSFSLLARETVDPQAKRRFSDGYLALTGAIRKKDQALEGVSRPLVNWTSPQSGPPMRNPTPPAPPPADS